MKNNKKISVLSLVLLCMSCTKESPPIKQAAPDTGRPETRKIEAADAMGYNGKEVRKKVDSVLDANDAHNAELEKQMQDNN